MEGDGKRGKWVSVVANFGKLVGSQHPAGSPNGVDIGAKLEIARGNIGNADQRRWRQTHQMKPEPSA